MQSHLFFKSEPRENDRLHRSSKHWSVNQTCLNSQVAHPPSPAMPTIIYFHIFTQTRLGVNLKSKSVWESNLFLLDPQMSIIKSPLACSADQIKGSIHKEFLQNQGPFRTLTVHVQWYWINMRWRSANKNLWEVLNIQILINFVVITWALITSSK